MQGTVDGREVILVADRELRTPKFLYAVSMGVSVVEFPHLDACKAAKVWFIRLRSALYLLAHSSHPLAVRLIEGVLAS